MNNAPDTNSTRPYLIRALYEWCIDNAYTPYLSVSVDDSVQVPREYVKDGEIVLNISFDATSSLKLGNDYIEFKGRFAGTARDIAIPINQVIAIYARENGQGMAFPIDPVRGEKTMPSFTSQLAAPEAKLVQLAMVESEKRSEEFGDESGPPRSVTPSSRPVLTRVK